MQLLVMSKVDLPAHFLATVLMASRSPMASCERPAGFAYSEPRCRSRYRTRVPISAPAISGSAYADIGSAEALAMQFKEAIPHTRGAQDVSLFRRVAPSVVLIFTAGGIGSGSVLQGNLILTNLHVVDHNQEVTVLFKPANPNGKAATDEVVKGDIVRVDVQRDLALIRPRSLPNHTSARSRSRRRILKLVRTCMQSDIPKAKIGRIQRGSSVPSDQITNGHMARVRSIVRP